MYLPESFSSESHANSRRHLIEIFFKRSFWLSSVYLGALIVGVPLVAVLTGTDRPVEGCGAECLGATHWETAGMGTSGNMIWCSVSF